MSRLHEWVAGHNQTPACSPSLLLSAVLKLTLLPRPFHASPLLVCFSSSLLHHIKPCHCEIHPHHPLTCSHSLTPNRAAASRRVTAGRCLEKRRGWCSLADEGREIRKRGTAGAPEEKRNDRMAMSRGETTSQVCVSHTSDKRYNDLSTPADHTQAQWLSVKRMQSSGKCRE